MVNYAVLDRTFHALADSTRRGLLEQLSKGDARITELAEPHSMSLPAVSKHLRVLEEAGLVERARRGREHHMHAIPGPLEAARDWIALYAQTWKLQFDKLDAYLAEAQGKRRPKNSRSKPSQ